MKDRATKARIGAAGLATLLALTVPPSCATNPATGETQLALISEGQEIEMGRQTSRQVEQSIGLYEDRELQAYVDRIGQRMAAISERPNLPWSFDVVDDPVVNAFAVPGGFIYVTRGIMAHFNSEAELAAVLGHEIGHVTARHSVEQLSRAQLAQLGLGIGSIFIEPVAALGDVIGAGLGLLFLKFGRDDERQADALGVRYMVKENYDPNEAAAVHQMLLRQREAADGSGLPNWLSTHPSPEDRIQRIRQQIDTLPAGQRSGTVAREEYLRRLDGLVYGENPRNGFFRDSRFLHPELRFQIDFPRGWRTQNMAQAVVAVNSRQDAVVQLTLATTSGHSAAAQEFFTQQGIRRGRVSSERINGLPATVGTFQARTQQGTLEGIAAFLDYEGRTYQLLAYTAAGRYRTYDRDFERWISSFDRLGDPSALNVQPMRIDVFRVDRDVSIQQLAQRRGAPVSAEELALLNNADADATIRSGTMIKWVEGRRP